MKNVICISGSSRKGNSEKLMRAAAAELKKINNFRVTEIYLSEFNPRQCDGCLACDNTGKCHYDDGMNEINEQLARADGLLISTPARWALLSGSLKTFFDRTNPLAAKERLAEKKVAIFAVGQSQEEKAESIKQAAESVGNYCNDAGMILIGLEVIEGVLNPEDVDGKDHEFHKIKELALLLSSAI